MCALHLTLAPAVSLAAAPMPALAMPAAGIDPAPAAALLQQISNQPFDAAMRAAVRALVGQTFPVSVGIGTPPLGISGAMLPADLDPGVAAPGNGRVFTP